MFSRLLMLFSLLVLLSACSKVSVDDYLGSTPELDLKEFLNGELKAYGILQNRSGLVTRKFTAELSASWEGNTGVIDEVFYFNDGEVETRVWRIEDLGDGFYQGTAGDVLGTAEGNIKGSAFRWKYQLEVPYGDDTISVTLDDWLYLVDESSIINKTTLTKFGFRVGELTLFIEKL